MYYPKVKMHIKFPAFPVIYGWIESAYEKCQSLEDYIKFYEYCLDESEITHNKIKKEAYQATAQIVYSKLCGRSYESIPNKIAR